MEWRDALFLHFGPGLLGGATVRDWVRLLSDNRFAVSPGYALRLMAASLHSAQTSLAGWYEGRRFGPAVNDVTVPPPVFVLGHRRSGTTHLHNLLAADRRFAFPSNAEVFFPHTFLSTGAAVARLMGVFLPRRRPMDNVVMRADTPQEDEYALAVATGLSPYLGWVFPRRQGHYDRYLTFRGVPADEVRRWRDTFALLLRKLAWKHGCPLVLKSPPHTARIRLLLETFPGAKFVHIHRDPYAVFRSSRLTFRVASERYRVQRVPSDDRDDWILRQYRAMYDAFFEERCLIPAGHYYEVGFEELEADPVGEMCRVYAALRLPAFEAVEPALRRYVASIAGYRKNEFPALPTEIRARVAASWRPSFEEWGYPT